MKEILREVSCYQEMGRVKVKDGNNQTGSMVRPKLPILRNVSLAYSLAPKIKLSVTALLDTGNDITIVNPQTVKRLEREIKRQVESEAVKADFPLVLPVERRIEYYEENNKLDPFQPAYDLAFFFTDADGYSSPYGFIAPEEWNFENIDMWLGLDVFSKLVVTFDGVRQLVTIADPNKS